jgi:hypothetical protein
MVRATSYSDHPEPSDHSGLPAGCPSATARGSARGIHEICNDGHQDERTGQQRQARRLRRRDHLSGADPRSAGTEATLCTGAAGRAVSGPPAARPGPADRGHSDKWRPGGGARPDPRRPQTKMPAMTKHATAAAAITEKMNAVVAGETTMTVPYMRRSPHPSAVDDAPGHVAAPR